MINIDDLIFRRAEIEDAKVLCKLAHELNMYHGDSNYPDESKISDDWALFESYVIEYKLNIIAFVVGSNSYKFHMAINRFVIEDLFVIDEFRQKGVGCFLMKEVIKIKKAMGVESFSLSANVDNNNARNFYNKLGFKEIKQGKQIRYALYGSNLKLIT